MRKRIGCMATWFLPEGAPGGPKDPWLCGRNRGVKAIHLVVVSGAALAACVPTGSAPPYDAGVAPTAATNFRPSLNVMTAAFEDTFDRPDSGNAAESTPWPAFEAGAPGTTATAAHD